MNKTINVITPTYYPDINGVSYVAQRNVEALLSLGYVVNVISSENARPISTENIYNFRIDGNGLLNNRIKGDIFSYINLLNRLSQNAEINIFHAWHTWTTNLVLNNLPKTKNILYSHGTSFNSLEPFVQRSLRQILYFSEKQKIKKYLNLFDGLISIVENKEHPRCFDIANYKGKIYTIKNPLPIRALKYIPPSFTIKSLFDNDEKVGLYISNFEPIKNQKFLLKLVEVYNFNLILVGSKQTNYSKEIVNYITSSGLSNRIKIFYNLDDDTIQMLFQDSDFFVMGSRNDFSPLVLIEANKNGLPFISFSTADLFNSGGYFCKNTKEYKTILSKFLNYNKTELRALGDKGRNYYSENNAKYCENLEKCISDILSSSK